MNPRLRQLCFYTTSWAHLVSSKIRGIVGFHSHFVPCACPLRQLSLLSAPHQVARVHQVPGVPAKDPKLPPYKLPPRGAPLFFWNSTTVQQVPFRDPLPPYLKCRVLLCLHYRATEKYPVDARYLDPW